MRATFIIVYYFYTVRLSNYCIVSVNKEWFSKYKLKDCVYQIMYLPAYVINVLYELRLKTNINDVK